MKAFKIRLFRKEDAQELAVLISRTLREVNANDYPSNVIRFMCSQYTPEKLIDQAETRQIYVCERDGKLTGTVALQDKEILALYVHPDHMGVGIGKALMTHLEDAAKKAGVKRLNMNASLTAETFYRKLAYVGAEKVHDPFYGVSWLLHKSIG